MCERIEKETDVERPDDSYVVARHSYFEIKTPYTTVNENESSWCTTTTTTTTDEIIILHFPFVSILCVVHPLHGAYMLRVGKKFEFVQQTNLERMLHKCDIYYLTHMARRIHFNTY